MKKLGNKIIKIIATDSEKRRIKLRFADKFEGLVDISAFFINPKGLAAEIVKGNIFNLCFLESGALAWPNGLELCPDMLRSLIVEQSKKKAA